MNLNPTSRLPRLKTQPTITQLLEALELLGRIYAPSLRFQISAQRTNQDANQNATEVEEIDSIQIVRNDEIERRFAKNWLTMMIGSGLHWIEEEETEENQDEHSASASASAPSDNRSRDNGKWTASDLVDLAGNILASEARVEESEEGLDRTFTFPLSPSPFSSEFYDSLDISNSTTLAKPSGENDKDKSSGNDKIKNGPTTLSLTLHDLPLPPSGVSSSETRSQSTTSTSYSNGQHTTKKCTQDEQDSASAASAVGLQTWAASIVLADLLIRKPSWIHLDFGLRRTERDHLKILELGAGTGLVGLAAARYLQRLEGEGKDEVILTDYHHMILDHLRNNVESVLNTETSPFLEVQVEKLDWEEVDSQLKSQDPSSQKWVKGQGDSDLILAADVIYSPTHAAWLHSAILATLKVEKELSRSRKARAHVLCARRERGRFGEWGLIEGVDKVFGSIWKVEDEVVITELRVLERRELPRVKGLGREDENGWVCWTLGWVS